MGMTINRLSDCERSICRQGVPTIWLGPSVIKMKWLGVGGDDAAGLKETLASFVGPPETKNQTHCPLRIQGLQLC